MNQATIESKLNLAGPSPDLSRFEIKKNTPQPKGRMMSSIWDHLIAKMDEGDSIVMDKRDSNAFSNRARKLGFVIVISKLEEDQFLVWFGGLKSDE